jgi:dipeptidyl aminopeptidase/acylaminoacyl peptidase
MFSISFSGCGAKSGIQSTPDNPSAVPLVSRTVMFGNPERAMPTVSPDGVHIAYLAEVDGVMNVWVAPVAHPDRAQAVTQEKIRPIRQYQWSYNDTQILYVQDQKGDENWHVYATDVKTRETKDLTPFDQVNARIEQASDRFPNEVLIAVNDRDKHFHDLHRVNTLTGERTLVEKNTQYAQFVSDDEFNVRMAMVMTPDGGAEYSLRSPGGEYTSFAKVPADDVMTTGPVGYDKSGRELYFRDSRGENTAVLYTIDSQTNARKELARDARADIEGVMVNPKDGRVQAASFNYDRQRWQVLDSAIEKDLNYLKGLASGDVEVLSRSKDDTVWTAVVAPDDGAARYYLYDRAKGKANFLFSSRSKLDGLHLAKMHPTVIKARDGLNLVSYLSLPCWADPKATGRPNEKLPMVLLVHGGPWARDAWGYNPQHQWLANRGYAVLSVNFRGSTGLGKAHGNAGSLEWGAKMHDDLIDAVNWAVAEKIANPDRIAIMGGSYGGYATLAGLTFTPDVFTCGVDIVGPSNLITLLNSIPPYWKPMMDVFTTRVGDPRTEEGKALLTARSPLTHVEKIKRPLLIAQGANDPRVKQAEADQIVNAMKAKKIPVTYVLFPDEGHGFARPENRTAFYAVAETFLAKHLGGRYEPIGNDLKGSSITAPEGASGVAGLAEALN